MKELGNWLHRKGAIKPRHGFGLIDANQELAARPEQSAELAQ
jgi:hypothetical protein